MNGIQYMIQMLIDLKNILFFLTAQTYSFCTCFGAASLLPVPQALNTIDPSSINSGRTVGWQSFQPTTSLKSAKMGFKKHLKLFKQD